MMLGQSQIHACLSHIANKRCLIFDVRKIGGKFLTFINWKRTQRANYA